MIQPVKSLVRYLVTFGVAPKDEPPVFVYATDVLHAAQILRGAGYTREVLGINAQDEEGVLLWPTDLYAGDTSDLAQLVDPPNGYLPLNPDAPCYTPPEEPPRPRRARAAWGANAMHVVGTATGRLPSNQENVVQPPTHIPPPGLRPKRGTKEYTREMKKRARQHRSTGFPGISRTDVGTFTVTFKGKYVKTVADLEEAKRVMDRAQVKALGWKAPTHFPLDDYIAELEIYEAKYPQGGSAPAEPQAGPTSLEASAQQPVPVG